MSFQTGSKTEFTITCECKTQRTIKVQIIKIAIIVANNPPPSLISGVCIVVKIKSCILLKRCKRK